MILVVGNHTTLELHVYLESTDKLNVQKGSVHRYDACHTNSRRVVAKEGDTCHVATFQRQESLIQAIYNNGSTVLLYSRSRLCLFVSMLLDIGV